MGAVETITIGANDYSVYGLGNSDPVADADEYFAARLGAASWTGATTAQKQQALITATRMGDRRMTYTGTKTVASQALAWPRDSATCDGNAVADGTVPDQLVLGHFELALALLEDEAVQDSSTIGSNLKRAKAGSAEVEFFRPTIGDAADLQLPVAAWELIGCYSAGTGAIGAPFVDGTDPGCIDERSRFDTGTDSYNRSEGYA